MVRIEAEPVSAGVHKTVIKMGSEMAVTTTTNNNVNFRFLQECLDWVKDQLVSVCAILTSY